MNITSCETNLFFNAVGLFIGLVGLILLAGIIRRTKKDVKSSFLVVLIGFVGFLLFEFLKIFELYTGSNFISDLFIVIFISFIVAGVYKFKALIQGLSDYGQAFVITSKRNYEDKISSISRDVKGICYLTLDRSCEEVKDSLEKHGLNTEGIIFLNASGNDDKLKNCIKIENQPEKIKDNLRRVLREKNIKCVVIDDVSSVNEVEKFEIPLFVQQVSSLIKANESQGFFIGRLEKIDKQMINDISMLVDKVLGE
ncbi:MAG: hypothetical protein V5A64_02410 [Candidatus Thermoplasmatota archaeon]